MPVEYCDNGPLWVDELPWQKRGLMETATGYGRKLTTRYKTTWNGRTYRVYCCCFSNAGTLYIISKGRELAIRNEEKA